MVPRLAELSFNGNGNGSGAQVLREGGFYVVTGGLGGLGRLLTRYLATQLGARVLLLGRSPLDGDSEKADALRELRVEGDIDYAAVDVADRAALASVLDTRKNTWGLPDGVFHLAGTFRTAPLDAVSQEALHDELRAKAAGTVALRQVLPDPCLFFGFGSVNAFFGGATAGVYSAANRFLEAFVEAEHAAGIHSSRYLGWSMWDEIGMSRGYLLKEASRAQGFSTVPAAKGLASLRALLARGNASAYVGLDAGRPRVRSLTAGAEQSTTELAAWYSARQDFNPALLERLEVRDRFGTPVPCVLNRLEKLPLGDDGTVDDDALLRRSAAGNGTPVVEPRTSSERLVASIWQEILELDAVDVNRSFFELGGQSVLLVQVHHRLAQLSGRSLTVVDLLRYPTIGALASFLDQEQKAKPTFAGAAARASKQRSSSRRQRPRTRLPR
jgi:hypothetical protein